MTFKCGNIIFSDWDKQAPEKYVGKNWMKSEITLKSHIHSSEVIHICEATFLFTPANWFHDIYCEDINYMDLFATADL